MIETHLIRISTSSHGTQGVFYMPGFSCFTMEPPWRDNQRNVSCIPGGEYEVEIRISPKYGPVYWVTNVEDRSFILIHPGNWGGDVSKGLWTHTNGCILFGLASGELSGQKAVLNSRLAVSKFMRLMNNEPFKLSITGAI